MAKILLATLCVLAASERVTENPIRKVVTLMQNMQKEIEAEGKKEKELFDKFMCFCSGNNGDLEKKAADGKARIEELSARLKSETAEKTQIAQELIDHKKDREAASADLKEATVIREKEAAEFAEMKADSEKNIAAMASAIPALEKGMGSAALLQMPDFDRLKKVVQVYAPTDDDVERRDVLAFFEQSGDYVPQSGQIVGILKGMKDSMEANLAEAVNDEEKAVSGYAELKASKEKEGEIATEAIETKTSRAGNLAVSVVQTKDDLEDTEKEVAETEKFAVQLKEQCGSKEKEWAVRQKQRAEEITAISEAIGILNDDDALDVFKKALPSALVQEEVGFLQARSGQASKAHKAQAILSAVAAKYNTPQVKLMLFTLSSKLKLKSQNFGKIIKMIDEMVGILKKDQTDDDKQKSFCEAEFEKASDEEAVTKSKIESHAAAIAETNDEIEALTDEVATLKDTVKSLDKAVAQATEQRKEEHEDYTTTVQLNGVAAQLVDKAKNRLQKFYNPTMYKAPPKTEMSAEEKIIQAGSSFAQIRALDEEDQPQAPETFSGDVKKSGKSSGVIALMDMILKDLANDTKDMEYEEKTAQKDYAELMGDSQANRSQATKSITDKMRSRAQLEDRKVRLESEHSDMVQDLKLVQDTIADLHVSCDFLMQNYDLRKEARTNESESLKNAKAILSGADFR